MTLAEQVAEALPCRTQQGENYDFCDGDSHDFDCWAYKRPRILALVEKVVAEASERVRRAALNEAYRALLTVPDDTTDADRNRIRKSALFDAGTAIRAIAALKENK